MDTHTRYAIVRQRSKRSPSFPVCAVTCDDDALFFRWCDGLIVINKHSREHSRVQWKWCFSLKCHTHGAFFFVTRLFR